ELTLVRWAMSDDKPVLGVCRGIQAINVAAGGTLYQDVGAQHPGAIKHDYFPTPGGQHTRSSLTHEVRVEPQTRLRQIVGGEQLAVNSMHHQGIKRLAPGLAATAFAPDGLIEGVEGRNGHFLIGVQWHPEELTDTRPDMQRLFGEFIEAASRHSSNRATGDS